MLFFPRAGHSESSSAQQTRARAHTRAAAGRSFSLVLFSGLDISNSAETECRHCALSSASLLHAHSKMPATNGNVETGAKSGVRAQPGAGKVEKHSKAPTANGKPRRRKEVAAGILFPVTRTVNRMRPAHARRVNATAGVFLAAVLEDVVRDAFTRIPGASGFDAKRKKTLTHKHVARAMVADKVLNELRNGAIIQGGGVPDLAKQHEASRRVTEKKFGKEKQRLVRQGRDEMQALRAANKK